MQLNIILAGVGGQGILTIARILSEAAIEKGLHVKQAETHGMSQRGGAVYSHLRISDSEIYSELIPAGRGDLVLAVEPLEALRYVPMLKPSGAIVANTNAVANINDYPPIETVLDHITAFRNHVALDMDKLGRAAGSTLAANVAALGAALPFLPFSASEIESSIERVFQRKGERFIDVNLRALRFGRTAASAYVDALANGALPRSVRSWIEEIPAEMLASDEAPVFAGEPSADVGLSGPEAHAFESILMDAYTEGRRQLYEHEVYRLIELVGAIAPPRHAFVPKGSSISPEVLAQFSGQQVVVKLVSPQVIHKTEAKAVLFVPKEIEAVKLAIDRMVSRHAETSSVAGVLVVEFVEHEVGGLGSELFVGIRASRDFGPVIAAGLGGLETEFLASKLRPGIAAAKALAFEVDAEAFLDLFKKTVAYELLSGQARGHKRVVEDRELLRCFGAFIAIARKFCVDRGEEGPDIGELEVNPFAFVGQKPVPLDGRGRLQPAAKDAPARPKKSVANLLEPSSIAVIGVPSKPDGLGRVILGNILRSGFDARRIWCVKEGVEEIDGVSCVPSIEALPEPVDLLVVSTPSSALPEVIRSATDSGKVRSAILISGGVGETEGTEALRAEVARALSEARAKPEGPVFLGPNCLGVRSASGPYDTFFVPDDKLASGRSLPSMPVAILSQSGAFVVSRLSSFEGFNPKLAVSLGNQADVSLSDLLAYLESKPEITTIGVYLEGFSTLDGLKAARSMKRLAEAGRNIVFYKAGRTESGRTAAQGHTSAIAGDYDICQSALEQSGALVTESFREFSQLLELAVLLDQKQVSGGRVLCMTNAGMEAVAVADALGSSGAAADPGHERNGVRAGLAELTPDLEAGIGAILTAHGLDSIVNPRNPLDLTPMASERVYDEVVRLALDSKDVDCVVVSCVPLAPSLKTLKADLGQADSFPELAKRWLSSGKPVVFVVDSGAQFDPLAAAIRRLEIPVFRSADEAVLRLRRWMEHRLRR